MTQRRPPGPRLALPELAARFVVFVSLACVIEFLVHAVGLRFVVTGLLAPPAAVLLAWHWPYAAGNRFVLAAVAPLLAYLAFAWSYGSSESTPPGLLRVYLFNCLLLALVAAHVARSSDAAVRGLIGVARIALLVASTTVFLAPNPPHPEGVDDPASASFTLRDTGFFWNPNDAALASVLLLNFVLHRPWNRRLLNWFAAAAATAATVQTLSRTGAALLLASLVLFLWTRRKWMILSVTSAAALTFLAAPRPFLDAFQQRVAPSFLNGEEALLLESRLEEVAALLEGEVSEATTSFRSTLWLDGVALIRDTFPHGSGLGSFLALEGSIFVSQGSHPVFGQGGWHGVHNVYLLVAGEAGFVAFALLVFCYGGLLAKAWFSPRDGLPLAIVVVTLLYWGVTHNFLGDRYHLVAFAVAVGLLARRAPAAHGARTDGTVRTVRGR